MASVRRTRFTFGLRPDTTRFGALGPSGEMSTNEVTPRYEFRAFAPNFGTVERRLKADAAIENLEEDRQIYLVSGFDRGERNVKIRDGALDVKVLGRRDGELELWRPEARHDLPVSADELETLVLEPLEVRVQLPPKDTWTLADVLSDIVTPTAGLVAALVDKRRRTSTLGPNGSIRAEHTEVTINGASIQTIAVESENRELVAASLEVLGLDVYRNINYVSAIKMITGLTSFHELGADEAWEKSAWEKR